MRREGHHIQRPIVGTRAADFDQAPARGGEVREIALGINKGRWFGASASGKGDEDRPELGFKLFFHPLTSAHQGPKNRAGPARQEIFVGNQDKFPGFLGMFGRVQQVRFRGEGQALQIVQRADRFNIEAEPAENLAIMSRERQDHPPEIAAELFGLEPANNRFRQLLPTVPEQVHAHD